MKNILYIDDELYFVSPYIEILEMNNFNVKTINTVEKAEKIISSSEYKFDLIILDMMIFGTSDRKSSDWRKSGIYLFKYILDNIEVRPAIVFISVNNLEEITNEVAKISKEYEFSKYEYLIKPVRLKLLLSTVKNLLNIDKGDICLNLGK